MLVTPHATLQHKIPNDISEEKKAKSFNEKAVDYYYY